SSEEWKKVSDSERKNLGLTVKNDGEFWMTFEDWCKNFTDVDVCRTVNTSYFSLHKTWEKEMMHGAWAKHPEPLLNRSGGCFDNRETFLQNPQVGIPVFLNGFKTTCQMICLYCTLCEKLCGARGESCPLALLSLLALIPLPLQVEDNRRYRLHKLTVQERVATSPYSNTRSVFLRRTLQQGRYVLIPTTYLPGVPTKFILRLYTDVPSKLRELKADRPKMTCWSLLCGYPRRVTQIKVQSAEGLQKQDRSGGADPYVLIKCENQSRRSPVQHGTTSPVFNTQVIFYRKDIDSPVTIQVWNSNLLSDQFLGQAVLAASPADPRGQQTLRLRGRGGREAAEVPGRITVKVLSSDDLAEL
ncbi:CAN5 protein, partial [Machaerirhynchus nigripectus]|nr:CAN5 protein [Machaerirhynchus nigripectus]